MKFKWNIQSLLTQVNKFILENYKLSLVITSNNNVLDQFLLNAVKCNLTKLTTKSSIHTTWHLVVSVVVQAQSRHKTSTFQSALVAWHGFLQPLSLCAPICCCHSLSFLECIQLYLLDFYKFSSLPMVWLIFVYTPWIINDATWRN